MGKSRQASDLAWQATRKNLLINGCFRVWQRGTSQTSDGIDSDDRWVNSDIGATKTSSRQEFTTGQTDVPGEPRYYSRTVSTAGSGVGDFCIKYQRVENVRTAAGKPVTYSFWAKADATKTMALEWFRTYGTGGSPSTDDDGSTLGYEQVNLTTSWQRFEITKYLPLLAGKTIGTNGNSWIGVVHWFDAGSNYDSRTGSLGHQSGTFDIAQVQMEVGEHATDFEQRPIGEELALSQRYYLKLPGDEGVGALYAGMGSGSCRANNQANIIFHFPVEMRAPPTVFTGGSISVNDGNAEPFSSTSNLNMGTRSSLVQFNITGTGFGVGNGCIVHRNNDTSAYVAFDAEL